MTARQETIRIVIAGGGTGGHLFPGLATAEAIKAAAHHVGITFVGTGRPVEERALAGKPYEYRVLRAPRLERSLHPRNFLLPASFGWAVVRAGRLLRELTPALVMGTGGYASAPVVVAARLRRAPTVILEQNIMPGLTNRLLSRVADVACVAFEPSRDWLAARVKVVVTGNPIRSVSRADDAAGARARLGLAEDLFTVFIFGGSQGAQRLVSAAKGALDELAGRDLQLVVQTGDAAALDVPALWRGRLVVRPFFDEIYDCYRAADLVVCRAGGGAAEVLAFGKPMVLVPYPFAAHGHQQGNAAYLEQEGAAAVVEDEELDGAKLAALILEFEGDDERRAAMARASRELGRPDAAARVAREALALAGITA
jgi:UDP-N-acetylglucosamine--N-acetylmuramyl-(pentapeptide) pyrophosphoryl-undecaprenol N-acetylglucosamine transferase